MIIECPHCETKVDGIVKGEHEYCESDTFHSRAVLLACPVCHNPLVGVQDLIPTGPQTEEWYGEKRVWPQAESLLDSTIPDSVRHSLEEAHLCFKIRAYRACAVMCGRSLEGLCHHFKTHNQMLAPCLKELRDSGVIDARLFQWGEPLRIHRNLGAHATDAKISRQDAKDLLDFANAICEFVFVLSDRYDKFMQRSSATKGP